MRLTFFIFVNDGKNLEQLQNPTNIRNVREIVDEEFACQRVGFLLSQTRTVSNRNYLESARDQVSNGNFITHCSALK